MENSELHRRFADLTTPHVADALLRLGLPVRQAPASVRPLWSGTHVVGRVCPTRHSGSVDVFLEALHVARPGDVLVVDNGGRDDEACVGDLVTMEVQGAGLSGIVVWGLHRDSAQLRTLRLPVFSQGTLPGGPQRLDPRPSDAVTRAHVGTHSVTAEDFVLADDDGVLFLPLSKADEIASVSTSIRETERAQATRMALGTSFREQARFADFLLARDRDGITFREHLRALGAAVEE